MSSADSARPATPEAPRLVVSLTGIHGVEPAMSVAQIWRRWQYRFPLAVETSGSGFRATGLLCKGPLRGVAYFSSAGARPIDLGLNSVWFFGGVTTDRGIGIGGTVTQLRRAYGRRLIRRGPDLYEVSQGPGRKNAISFSMTTPTAGTSSRITRIGFGWTGILRNTEPFPIAVYCGR
jgi:hypothetical protein